MPDTMQAARFIEAHRPLELQELPVPEPGPLEVLVKVEACGICLSDVHIIDRSIRSVRDEVTLGHESCGTIAAIGDLVQGWQEGQRVTLAANQPRL